MNRRFLLVLFVLVFSLLMASAAMASAKYMSVQDMNVIAESGNPESTRSTLDRGDVPEAPPGDEGEVDSPGEPLARPGPSIPPSLLSMGEQESYLPGRDRPTWQLLEQEPVYPPDPANNHRTSLLEQPGWKLSSGGWGANAGVSSFAPAYLTQGFEGVTLVVHLGSNYVFGLIDPNTVATVFVDGAQVGASQADDRGFFWTTLYDSSGNRVILEGGEVVEVKKQDGTSIKSITIKPISGEVDQGDNSVSGQIGGSTSSGIEVTVYAPGAENPELNCEKMATTGANGSFEVDFDGVYEFMAWDEPIIQYIEDGVVVRRRVWAEPSLAVRPAPFSMVYGHAEQGTTITATLYDGSTVKDSIQSTVPDSAFYVLTFEEQISAGDRVVVEFEGGESLEVTVEELTMAVDPLSDAVTGKAVPGVTVYGYAEDLNVHGWMPVEVDAAADSNGDYHLYFGADLLPGTNVWVFTKDAQGNIQDMCAWAPSVEVFQTYDEVNGAGSMTPLLPEDSRQITLTLYSADSGVVSTFVTEMNPRGRYFFNAKDDNLPDIRPGDVVTVTSGAIDGWKGVVHVGSVSAAADLEADQFAGTVAPSTGRVELSGWYYPPVPRLGWAFDTLAVVDGTGSFTAAPPMFDLNENLAYQVSRRDEAEHLERIDSETGGFGVVLPANLVCPSLGEPGIPFTVTLYKGDSDVIKAELNGVSKGPIGNAQELSFWDKGQQILPGDKVRLQGGNGYDQSVVIPDLSITIDAVHDVLQVRAPANHLVFVDVYDHGRGWMPSGPDGDFTVKPDQLQEVWSDGDLEWGDRADIMWLDENHTWVYAFSPNWPVIAAASDMEGRSSVYGFDAVPWSTIAITITDESGDVVASGSTTAGSCDWCRPSDYWLGFPDRTIQPGNTVTVDFGFGFKDSVKVVEITAGADVGSDTVSGTAPGDAWLSSWVHNPRGEGITLEDVQADGDGNFTFHYGTAGWDVVDGDEFGIHYRAPHGHIVEYYFWLPAPELGVWKHTTGGFARPDGVYVYEISYDNRGTGPALNTLITDTLPAYTSWAGDTSGFEHYIGANGVVTWNLGTLLPNNSGRFMVTLDVDPGIPGDIESNCAGISTSSPGDWETVDNSICTEDVHVEESGVEISVDTWPNPGDPAAGQKFEYGIRVCNERGAAVGPVWLTVTLPADTSLVSWRPENDWERFWVESSFDAGKLVLFAPGFPGWMCNNLHVRLQVNPGTPLETILRNRVEISTAGDENPDNNLRVNEEAWVSEPRYDMNIGHWYNAGILTPGGWINYGVSYWNDGNTNVQGQITATLPTGTSYQPGSGRLHNGKPFEPVEITGSHIVWDLGDEVEVNTGFGFDYTIEIFDSVSPGTVLEDCVEIGIPFEDVTPHNNRACVRETVLGPGPNLRVWKWHNWNGDGQLRYDLRFENNGNETLTDIWLTDTLPLGTEWDGWWDMGFDWSRLVTQTLESDRLVWRFSELYPGDSGWINFNAKLEKNGELMQWYTNTLEISAAESENETVLDDNKYEDVAFSRGEVEYIEFSNIGSQNSMWGRAQPDTELTVTTANGSVSTTVREDGNWDIPDVGLVEPGDTVTVTAGEGQLPVVIEIPDPFSVEVDSDTDKISGQVGSLASGTVQVHGYWLGGFREVQISENGAYVASYPEIPRGARGHIRYETIIDHAVVVLNREFYSLDLLLRVNYAHDWVEGNYEAGHTVWITVTESDGHTEKGTAVLTTAPIPWWGDQTGFATHIDDYWVGQVPNIQPGDWVYGKVDNGQTASVQIMEITGDPDSEADTIEGTMDVAGFGEPVRGRCEIWEENGPQAIDFVVGPSDLNYFCDFGDVGWDLVPGQEIGVRYIEPDQDEVINVFEEATPHLRIEKYSEGSPGVGGNLSFVIRLYNDGKAPAENVIITDTMQGISYLSDTSEMAAITGILPGGDAYVRWELGSLGPESYTEFTVFVSVDAAVGENITNHVQITTTNPYDQGEPSEKESTWHGVVEENNTNLNVGKYPWTGDPAPGEDFIWAVNVCNNGSTGSSTLVLTDTLPLHTSLNGWWPQHPGWEVLESGGDRLVLSRPSLPAHSCSEVYLDLHLDDEIEVGTGISNTAEIYASGDLEDGNWTESRVTVSHPYLNLGVGTGWSRGTLVPGGELYYNVSYWNNGNLPVTEKFLITATLPAHTSFRSAWDSQGELLPLEKGDGYVVFRFDGLRNGFSGGFEIVLDVENDAEPGTVLTNTVEITPYEGESSYDDNISAWTEQLYAHGPNLRVRKEAGWHGDWQGHAWYQVTVENVGDAGVKDVWITDEYPADMILEGDPWPDWNLIDVYEREDENSLFRMKFFGLPAGFRHDFGFNAVLKEPDALGLVLTNTLSVDEPPGDTNAADNTATAVLTTGPDLFVEKTLVGGDLVPGGTAVFSLRFGNDVEPHTWWWGMRGNLQLTDTLPAGFEFITSTLTFCEQPEPCPIDPIIDGNKLHWDLYSLHASEWNEIQVVVKIPVNVGGISEFTNSAEVASDRPDKNIEPDYDNNSDNLTFRVALPEFQVSKVYESSRIAGTEVVYKLTVMNTGQAAGTGISLIDPLPDLLAYSGGGSYEAGVVGWDIDRIEPGGKAERSFSGTLSCTAGGTVTNQGYRVDGSDQGITSDEGAEVRFDILPPVIDAGFDASQVSVGVGDIVYFTNTSTTNGTPLAYEWDFDDGGSDDSEDTSHAFLAPGVYKVKLKATDGCGYSDTHSITITVTETVEQYNLFLPLIIK